MIELAVGAALVGVAAWMGRRSGGLGANITRGMSDEDFVEEYFARTTDLMGKTNEFYLEMYEVDQETIKDPLDCGKARRVFLRARDSLRDLREASRSPRIPNLIRECTRSPAHRRRYAPLWPSSPKSARPGWTTMCEDLRDARRQDDEGVRDMIFSKQELEEHCGGSPSLDGFDAKITPRMKDHEFATELWWRATKFLDQANMAETASFAIYDYDRGEARDKQCAHSRKVYESALNSLQEARKASRHPRVPKLIKKHGCASWGGPSLLCADLSNGAERIDAGLRLLKKAREFPEEACGKPHRPIPLSRAM